MIKYIDSTIIGNDVDLEKFGMKYAKLLVKWRNSENVKKYFVIQEDITFEEVKRWFDKYMTNGKTEQFIIKNKNSEPIGTVYLRDVNYENGKAEFGIYLGAITSFGKGYGTEATLLILDYAFDILKLDAISLRVLKDNLRAIKSYERCGFVEYENIDEEKTENMIFMVRRK